MSKFNETLPALFNKSASEFEWDDQSCGIAFVNEILPNLIDVIGVMFADVRARAITAEMFGPGVGDSPANWTYWDPGSHADQCDFWLSFPYCIAAGAGERYNWSVYRRPGTHETKDIVAVRARWADIVIQYDAIILFEIENPDAIKFCN